MACGTSVLILSFRLYKDQFTYCFISTKCQLYSHIISQTHLVSDGFTWHQMCRYIISQTPVASARLTRHQLDYVSSSGHTQHQLDPRSIRWTHEVSAGPTCVQQHQLCPHIISQNQVLSAGLNGISQTHVTSAGPTYHQMDPRVTSRNHVTTAGRPKS